MSRDMRDVDRWLQEHPVLAWIWTVGIAVLILYLVILMDWATRR